MVACWPDQKFCLRNQSTTKNMANSKKAADARTLRKKLRQTRRELPLPYRMAASAKICEAFAKLDGFVAAKTVSGFLAFDGEADPLGLMIHACKLKKEVFVPIVVGKSKSLMFAPWTPTISMKENRFIEKDLPYLDSLAAINFQKSFLFFCFNSRGERF